MRDYPPAEVQMAIAGKNAVLLDLQSVTVGENIDRQIDRAIAEVERLKKVKDQLESSGLLKISIADLRQAMQF